MYSRSSQTNSLGVSSIVGVILMVALTVVLAAVLGQFVFGMVSDLKKPPSAGVAFQVDYIGDDQYDVTTITTAMPNADQVEVRPSNGPGMNFEEVGDSQTEEYSEGTTLTVLAIKGDQSVVVQVYTIGND